MFVLQIFLRRDVDDEKEAKRIVDRIYEAANTEEPLEMQAKISQKVEIKE